MFTVVAGIDFDYFNIHRNKNLKAVEGVTDIILYERKSRTSNTYSEARVKILQNFIINNMNANDDHQYPINLEMRWVELLQNCKICTRLILCVLQ